MSDLMDSIGGRIRSLRKDKGWSQEELADRAGLHFTYIGKIERSEHKVTIESLEKVTRALGVSLEEFFHLIQPIKEGTFNSTITTIINHLLNRSADDQKKALHLLEFVLHWKDE